MVFRKRDYDSRMNGRVYIYGCLARASISGCQTHEQPQQTWNTRYTFEMWALQSDRQAGRHT